MKKITTRLCHTRNIIGILFLLCPFQGYSQPEIENHVEIVESVLQLCPSSACTSSITAVEVINTDAVEEHPLGDDLIIRAIVWSGAQCSDPNAIEQGFFSRASLLNRDSSASRRAKMNYHFRRCPYASQTWL